MFSGLTFLGSTLSLLPDEVLPRWQGVPFLDLSAWDETLGRIREWAFRERLVSDADEFIDEDTVEDVSKIFTPNDGLTIGLHLSPFGLSPNDYMYIEYPVVPMETITKRKLEVELVYLNMPSGSYFNQGVRFGFWIHGSTSEFVSVCYGKVVVEKFQELWGRLSEKYPTIALGDAGHYPGELDIMVNGDVEARFFKAGMSHDVQFSILRNTYCDQERETVN